MDNLTADQRAIRSLVPLAAWTLAWAASLAVARFGPGALWGSESAVSWIAVAANLAVGAGWIVAHARFLRGLDDLQRKIMLEAMAVALGVGVVGGFAYGAASRAELVEMDANIAFLSALMAAVYAAASVVGNLRYR